MITADHIQGFLAAYFLLSVVIAFGVVGSTDFKKTSGDVVTLAGWPIAIIAMPILVFLVVAVWPVLIISDLLKADKS